MSRVVFQGETYVSDGGAPRRFRFEVRMVEEKQLVMWLEDCATKMQWQTPPMGFDKRGLSQAHCQDDEVERVAKHVADCLSVSSNTPLKMKIRDGRASAMLYLTKHFSHRKVDGKATYGVEFHARTHDRDKLEARIRDLEESVRPPDRPSADGEWPPAFWPWRLIQDSIAHVDEKVSRVKTAMESESTRVIFVGIAAMIMGLLLVCMHGKPWLQPGQLRLQHESDGRSLTLSKLHIGTCYTFKRHLPHGITRAMWNRIGESPSTEVLFYAGEACDGKQVCMAVGRSGECAGSGLASSLSFAVSDHAFSSSWFSMYERRWVL